jgi:hypothetical protein
MEWMQRVDILLGAIQVNAVAVCGLYQFKGCQELALMLLRFYYKMGYALTDEIDNDMR